MYLNRAFTDSELRRDLTVQKPLGGETDDFPLACRQTPEPGFPLSFINRVLAAVTVVVRSLSGCTGF